MLFASCVPSLNFVYVLLLGAGFCCVEFLIGGTRLLFSLPTDGIFALAAFLSVYELRRSKVRPNGLCLASSALFFAYILWRTLYSPVAYLAWPDEFSVLGALIVYLITACYFTDPRRRLWLLYVLLAVAFVNLAIAARQFSVGDDYMLNGFMRSPTYRGRGSGFYICPDHLAGYLEVVGSLTLAQGVWSRQPAWIKLLLFYCGLCCLGGIMLTSSRGGAISGAAALLTLIGLSLRRAWAGSPRVFAMAAAGIVVALLLVVFAVNTALQASPMLRERAALLLDRTDIRLLLWPAAVQEFKVSPIIGTGAGTYRYYGRVFRDPVMQMDPVRTHNDYLQLLAEYGLVGMAGLVLFLGAHFRWGWWTYRSFNPAQGMFADSGWAWSNAVAWNIGALAAAVSFVLHSVVDFNLHIPANAYLLAFVFGILANPGRRLTATEEAKPEGFRKMDLVPRLALPAIAIWICLSGLPKLPAEYYCEKARVAIRNGKNLAALHFAELGLADEKQNPDLYFYLGDARQRLAGEGRITFLSKSFLEGAIDPYRASLLLYPQDSRTLLRLGEALTRLRQFDEAAPVFDEALRWDPNSSMVYTYYGFYLQSAGRDTDARAAYQRALALGYIDTASQNLGLLSNTGSVAHPAE